MVLAGDLVPGSTARGVHRGHRVGDPSSRFAVSLSVYYLLLSISNKTFMTNLKRALIIELLWTQSRHHGGLCCS